MTSALCTLVFAAQAAVGCGFGGHHSRLTRPAPVRIVPARIEIRLPIPRIAIGRPPVFCDLCGDRDCRVEALLVQLAAAPRWRDRDNAAHALRKADWTRHPEVALALAAGLRDCEEEVREECAESLGDLNPPPCLPEVHGALVLAATSDPDHATRRDARKALDRLDAHCAGPCAICTPGAYDVGPPIHDSYLPQTPQGPVPATPYLEPNYDGPVGSRLEPIPQALPQEGFEDLPPLAPPLLPGPSEFPEVPTELAPLDYVPREAATSRADRVASRVKDQEVDRADARSADHEVSTNSGRSRPRRLSILSTIFRRRR